MPLQSQLSPNHPDAAHIPPAPEPLPGDAEAEAATSGAAPVWLQRFSLFVLVLFCVYLGILVMLLPWWTRVWDHNLFIQSHQALSNILHTGAARGIVSGIGLLDIWIGISEAVHYRDHRG